MIGTSVMKELNEKENVLKTLVWYSSTSSLNTKLHSKLLNTKTCSHKKNEINVRRATYHIVYKLTDIVFP